MSHGAEPHPETDDVALPAPVPGPANGTPGPQAAELTYLERIERDVGKKEYEKCWGRFVQDARCDVHISAQEQRLVGFDFLDMSSAQKADLVRAFAARNERYVMLVNNIDITWANMLGQYFNIHPSFFADHFFNTGYIDGMRKRRRYTLHWPNDPRARGIVMEFEDILNSTTSPTRARISYYHLPPHGWLLLVTEPEVSREQHIGDSPFGHSVAGPRSWYAALPTDLARWEQLRWSDSSQNVFVLSDRLLFLLDAADHNPESGMCRLFRHLLLIDSRDDVDQRLWSKSFNKVLWWTMVAIAWRLNINYLEYRLWALQREAISDPTMRTFLPLTYLRRNLADLRAGLDGVRLEISHEHEKALRELANGFGDLGTIRNVFDALLDRADHLTDTLGREIQLVIGSVQVRDSDNMKHQADRTLLLTLLAAVYLPLSLVTGIFGMNIREINGSTPQYWACLGAVGVAFVATGVLFLIGYLSRKWYRDSEAARATKFAAQDGYKMA